MEFHIVDVDNRLLWQDYPDQAAKISPNQIISRVILMEPATWLSAFD